MLYPIELLGLMTAIKPWRRWTAMDGVHVNGGGEFCHVVLRLFARKPILTTAISVSPRKHRHLA